MGIKSIAEILAGLRICAVGQGGDSRKARFAQAVQNKGFQVKMGLAWRSYFWRTQTKEAVVNFALADEIIAKLFPDLIARLA